jgi:hypothetical protein
MNNITPTPYKHHEDIVMTPLEKEALWTSISSHTFLKEEVLETSVRKPILSRLYYRGLLPAISQQSASFGKKKYALSFIAGTLIVTGGLSTFAQGALPGDFLYPVKTKVTEQVQVALLTTPEEKAHAEAILATKRLEEAETLALAGRLDQTKAQQTSEEFDEHVHKFEEHLTTLQQKKEFSVIAKIGVFFQTRIAVHAAVLKDIDINSKILASGKSPSSSKNVSVSRVILPLEEKALTAVIPTSIVTQKALKEIATRVHEVGTTSVGATSKSVVPLYIDRDEAKSYLLQLHENVGTPAPVLDATLAHIVPISVP